MTSRALGWHHNHREDRVTACRSELHSCKQGPEDFHFASEAEAEAYRRGLHEALRDPEATLRFTFADSLVVPFTEGDCGWLALAVSQLTGWGIVVSYGGPWEGADTAYNHCGVKLPDGRILDIIGIRPREEFLRWGGVKGLEEVSHELFDFMLPDRYFDEDPEVTARMIVRFLKTMGLEL